MEERPSTMMAEGGTGRMALGYPVPIPRMLLAPIAMLGESTTEIP
jgi:hypothetical protein